jgi:hypothetical protein
MKPKFLWRERSWLTGSLTFNFLVAFFFLLHFLLHEEEEVILELDLVLTFNFFGL